MWNGMESPDQLPGKDIVGANVAGTGIIFFIGGRTQDDQVSENTPGCARLNQREAFRIAPKPSP